MIGKKITRQEFSTIFQVKPYQGQFSCYGTAWGIDMYELGETEIEAVDKMWDRLSKQGLTI